jgi:endonuclease/exonuclease/phosphatase family metal-dependent hydrolase
MCIYRSVDIRCGLGHWLFTFTGIFAIAFAASADQCSPEPALTFEELVQISQDPIQPHLQAKLDRVLSEPVICNGASRDAGGHPIRVVEWNINHGLNEADIEAALSGSAAFHRQLRTRKTSGATRLLDDELGQLSQADVIVLDEVDYGLPRTHYRNVARDLAHRLGMNYAYAVEFIELNRVYLGLERMDVPDLAREEAAGEHFGVDPKRYRGTEGAALLSRYPIANAEVVRLPEQYNWYRSEVDAISHVEKARRWSAEKIFQERIRRQVRRGGRIALIADLEVPQSPTGVLTFVCPHLEDYTTPSGRKKQMGFLLEHIASIKNPVVLAGDLNSTGHDATPVTLKREILKRVTSFHFWASQAFFLASPIPGLRYMLFPANYFKNYHDPTAVSIPILLPNYERSMFAAVEKFRFEDGGGFDMSGNHEFSYRQRGHTLASSNERSRKGFTPTFALERTWHGLVGQYKIDWMMVKPASTTFRPFNGRTLNRVSRAAGDRISDHAPVAVSLETGNPKIINRAARGDSPARSRVPNPARSGALRE